MCHDFLFKNAVVEINYDSNEKREGERERKNGQHARTEEEEEEERETKELAFSRPQGGKGKKEKKIDPSVGRSVVVVYAGLISRSKTQKERT